MTDDPFYSFLEKNWNEVWERVLRLAEMNKQNVKTMNDAEVERLWQAFRVFDEDGSGEISADELGGVMRSLGQNPTDAQLHDMMQEVDIDGSGAIDFEEFKALMVSQQGDRESRLRLAFSVFDEDSSGHICANELKNVMSKFGLTDEELQDMIKEVDRDGDAFIDFEEFCQLVPEENEASNGYHDSYVELTEGDRDDEDFIDFEEFCPVIPEDNQGLGGDQKSSVTATQSLQAQSFEADTTLSSQDLAGEVTKLEEILTQQVKDDCTQKRGTSRLQMQIGLFRLIQGAAYRCFRESFSANHETHLRVRDLPYRISDFTQFVRVAITFYKGLGIVEEACYPVLDQVIHSIEAEYARLQDRIKNWQTIEKTPEMLAEAQRMQETRSKSATVREKFAAGVEFAITMKKKHLHLGDLVEGVLAINELNRLRQLELNGELNPPSPTTQGDDSKAYLNKWNRVILQDDREEIDGAMMPVAYWYEDFMPKLLAAFSLCTADDIERNTNPDEAALDQLYEETKAVGEFDRYGGDVCEEFPNCTPQQKLAILQAWRLSHHYLNGVQKRRERLEFGRECGALSQYVAFIDVCLNRSYVQDAQMRVSFPYYIGPGVWRFFHTSAEIVCTQSPEVQQKLIGLFKEFIKLFATMYPCPYCRHHLNAYVVQNKEVDMYPMEYLLLGQELHATQFSMSFDNKLATVTDGPSMRLFFWKLHNTVNSSIARSEEWYQRDDQAFYTSRYWPSLDAELTRARTLRHISITTDRIYYIYSMLKPTARLSGFHLGLQKFLDRGDEQGIQELCKLADTYIKELEKAVLEGNFLQDAYSFDPTLEDNAPYFTPEEEEFARSGVFVEVH